jgi:hypothetical protein
MHWMSSFLLWFSLSSYITHISIELGDFRASEAPGSRYLLALIHLTYPQCTHVCFSQSFHSIYLIYLLSIECSAGDCHNHEFRNLVQFLLIIDVTCTFSFHPRYAIVASKQLLRLTTINPAWEVSANFRIL